MTHQDLEYMLRDIRPSFDAGALVDQAGALLAEMRDNAAQLGVADDPLGPAKVAAFTTSFTETVVEAFEQAFLREVWPKVEILTSEFERMREQLKTERAEEVV